jgi:acetyl esterase/lipase
MDVFYTSVGTAMDFTHTSKDIGPQNTNWRLVLITAAAASFYSLTGANPSALVASQSETTAELIRNAWGMVSLPSIKGISLQACRLLKGAAVADRVEICGVSCFVLSSDPSPELAAAIKRKRRMHQRRKPISTLSTIDEDSEHAPADTVRHSKPFARSPNTRYRQRDVIFHLTGGGFFAHIIASDLPYLLDWSARTGAVVICPEYALLPEHRFPDALHEVEDVYKALVSDEAVGILGFETNRVVVTGESAGGNLAAALCVKLGMDNSGIPTSLSDEDNKRLQCNEHDIQDMDEKDLNAVSTSSRMPDALMLSCPVLNLTLETSHSRVVGTNDPVLPSGLISAISDAYLPSTLGISKKDPMASPFYAPDDVLRQFPPSLLFASSTNDPLLDDSVAFTKRLWTNGVEADLIAAQNLPHAYLGLGTAGFPDAQQIQEKCVSWLSQKLTTSFKN